MQNQEPSRAAHFAWQGKDHHEIVKAAVAATLRICPDEVTEDLRLGNRAYRVLNIIGATGIARQPLMGDKDMTVGDVLDLV